MAVRRLLHPRFYACDAVDLGPALLNKLVVTADGRAARIVEVESYRGGEDPASHAYRGRTPRNGAMWGRAGTLYVYRSYGIHWCANVVAGALDDPQAVLLRALEPVAGLGLMRAARRRPPATGPDPAGARDLCRGPGRLCQALDVDSSYDGADLTTRERIWLVDDGTIPPSDPLIGPRIGISVGVASPWRFGVPGSRFLSRPFPAAAR